MSAVNVGEVVFEVADWIIIVGSLIVAARARFVFRFRNKLNNRVHDCSMDDIDNNKNPLWRCDVLGQVGYNTMLWRFWKRLKVKSWWDNPSFLELGAADPYQDPTDPITGEVIKGARKPPRYIKW